jgi:hypothetical protein
MVVLAMVDCLLDFPTELKVPIVACTCCVEQYDANFMRRSPLARTSIVQTRNIRERCSLRPATLSKYCSIACVRFVSTSSPADVSGHEP